MVSFTSALLDQSAVRKTICPMQHQKAKCKLNLLEHSFCLPDLRLLQPTNSPGGFITFLKWRGVNGACKQDTQAANLNKKSSKNSSKNLTKISYRNNETIWDR